MPNPFSPPTSGRLVNFHPLYLTFFLLIRNNCHWCRKATRSRCLVTLTPCLFSSLVLHGLKKRISILRNGIESISSRIEGLYVVPSPVVVSGSWVLSSPLLVLVGRSSSKGSSYHELVQVKLFLLREKVLVSSPAPDECSFYFGQVRRHSIQAKIKTYQVENLMSGPRFKWNVVSRSRYILSAKIDRRTYLPSDPTILVTGTSS